MAVADCRRGCASLYGPWPRWNRGATVWDSVVIGFGARRQAGPASFVLRYRTMTGRQRTFTIGRIGSPWTPKSARTEALRLLGEVVRGGDPSADKRVRRQAMSVADLCVRYLEDAETGRLVTRRRVAKAASTIATDRSRIDAHIKPLLGHLPVAAVSRADVERFMHAVSTGETRKRQKLGKPHALSNVRGGIGVASRSVGLLGAIMTYAIRQGLRADNPVRGVVRPADGRRERRLGDEEYGMLGTGLRRAEVANEWPPAVAVIRFLLVTGWRSGEVLSLRWSEVDLDRRTARLTKTKTGASTRPLPEIGCKLLCAMPRGEFVFRAPGGDTPMTGFARVWERVAHRLGNLPRDVTPHVLRHSFASLAADLGHADATIAALLGHRHLSNITRRYIHSADRVLLAAANTVADKTVAMMAGNAGGDVMRSGIEEIGSDVSDAESWSAELPGDGGGE